MHYPDMDVSSLSTCVTNPMTPRPSHIRTVISAARILLFQTKQFEYLTNILHKPNPQTTAIMSTFIGPNMYLIESTKSVGLYLNLDGGNKADGTKVVSK